MKKILLLLVVLSNVSSFAWQSGTPEIARAAADSASGIESIKAANLLFRTGKFDQAISAYNAILTLDPKCVEGYAGLVRIHLKRQEIGLARESAKRAVLSVVDSALLHTVLGEIDFREGSIAEAEKEFVAALRIDPFNARAYLGRAQIYSAISMHKRAYEHIVKAHQIDPDDPEIQKEWFGTLKRADRIAAMEKYLAAAGNDDARDHNAMETYVRLQKERQKRPEKRCSLITKLDQTVTPLERLMYGPNRMRGWGLRVNINGRKSNLLLDTGASGVLINSKAAEKAGLTRITDSQIEGVGDSGPMTGYWAYADSLKVGELEFQNCLIHVSDKRSIAEEDGLIGADVFEDYLVTLNFPAGKMKLSPLPKRPDEKPQQVTRLKTDDTEDGNQVENTDSSVEIAGGRRDRYIAPEMQDFDQIFRFGHVLLIPTSVNSTPPKLFLIDTGAYTSMISTEAAREVTKVRKDSDTIVKGLNGTVKGVYRADKAVLIFSHFRQENQSLLTFDLSGLSKHLGTEVSGTLGFSLLNMMEMSIDYRDGLVNFKYVAPRGDYR